VTVRGSGINRLWVVRVRFAQPAEMIVAVLEVPSAEVTALRYRALVPDAEGRTIHPR
jgi:hypothetical protein